MMRTHRTRTALRLTHLGVLLFLLTGWVAPSSGAEEPADLPWSTAPRGDVVLIDAQNNQTTFSTVQEAVDAATSGSVIMVGQGVFDEYVVVDDKSQIEIRSNDSSTIRGFQLQQSDNITIDGFDIDPTGTTNNGISIKGGISQNSQITISNNEIHNANAVHNGIRVARDNSNITIGGNNIHDNGWNGIAFVDASGGPDFVTSNQIHANGRNGIWVGREHVITIQGNTITGNGTNTGIIGGRYGIMREGVSGGPGRPDEITLINNTITGNNGNVVAGKSSQDLGTYDQMLDATDSGNTTTAGDEGPGVSPPGGAPPAAPGISAPGNGTFLNDSTPPVSGTSDASGLTIDILVDGNPNGQTTSGTGGAWSIGGLPNALSEGAHSITATATNAVGTSPGSPAITVTIDTAPPVVSGPIPTGQVSDDTPAISASWSDLNIDTASAVITLDGAPVTPQTITSTGFTFTPATPLTETSHDITATISDLAGNNGNVLAWSFTVAPGPADQTPPTISNLQPVDGSVGNDPTPTLSASIQDTGGSGIDEGTVNMALNMVVIPATVVLQGSDNATVTFQVVVLLQDGDNVVTVDASDVAQNGPTTESSTFTVDTTFPGILITTPQTGSSFTSTVILLDVTISDATSGVDISTVDVDLNGFDITTTVTVTGEPDGTVTIQGALSAQAGDNLLVISAKDFADNFRSSPSSFNAESNGIDVPLLIISIEAVTQAPPGGSGDPGGFRAPTARPIMVEVKATSGGQPIEGIVIKPTITSGAGRVFHTVDFPQQTGFDGVAGFGFMNPRIPGEATVEVTADNAQTASSASFTFVASQIAPASARFGAFRPGNGGIGVLFTTSQNDTGRATVMLDEVDNLGTPITDSSLQKLIFPQTAFTTEPDGKVFVSYSIKTGTSGNAFLRATWPEFGNSAGNAITHTVQIGIGGTTPDAVVLSGRGQLGFPGQPLPQPVTVQVTPPFNPPRLILRADLIGSGSMTHLDGQLIDQDATHFCVEVTSGDTVNVQYTLGSDGRPAELRFKGEGFFGTGPITDCPLSGNQSVLVKGPQLMLVSDTDSVQLAFIPETPLETILTQSIPSDKLFHLEARLPEAIFGDSTTATFTASNHLLDPLPDDGLFPPVTQQITLTKQGTDTYVSGPLQATDQADFVEGTPSLPFTVIRSGEALCGELDAVSAVAVAIQAKPTMSPSTVPEIPDRGGPPGDFNELVNGRVNIVERPGEGMQVIQIDLNILLPEGTPANAIMISGRQRLLGQERILGQFFLPTFTGVEFTKPADEVENLNFVFNPLAAGCDIEATTLEFTMTGRGLPPEGSTSQVRVQLARFVGEVRITYIYVLRHTPAETEAVRNQSVDITRVHNVSRSIWRQVGIELVNTVEDRGMYRFLDAETDIVQIFDPGNADANDALVRYNGLAQEAFQNPVTHSPLTILFVHSIVGPGGITFGLPFALGEAPRFAIVTKTPFSMRLSEANPAHEIGHMFNLKDAAIPAAGVARNRNNLMMNEPTIRLRNQLSPFALAVDGTNEDQETVSRDQAASIKD